MSSFGPGAPGGARAPQSQGSGGVYERRKESQGMHHQASDKMRSLFMHNSQVYTAKKKQQPNPIWLEFPERCTRPVRTAKEMRALLDHYSNSDDVMVVRYHQEGCTACNAVDKIFEAQCHDQAKALPKLHFYDVKREDCPELAEGLIRYPQIKAFNGGQWTDMDFKPPQDYRDSVYSGIEREVHEAAKRGEPMTAQQAEEMYFSVSGPAISLVLEESIMKFYNQTQVRLHNYWKQVAQRRAWYFNKYLAKEEDPATPEATPQQTGPDLYQRWQNFSLFGEAVGEQAEEAKAKAAEEAAIRKSVMAEVRV